MQVTPLNDQQLIGLYLEGNEQAFEELKKGFANPELDIDTKINNLKKTLKDEGFGAMTSSFKTFEKSLQTAKLELINQFKDDILAALENEIIKRYFYRE